MANIKSSPRINELAKRAQGRLADIACDHAYISINAVLNKHADTAAAADIKQASVNKARENIKRYGLTDKITAFISDGLTQIPPASADCVIIAGIGGRLMRDILLKDIHKTKSFGYFVLEPQSEVFLVRRALHNIGFVITNEVLINEGLFYYPIIEARPGAEEPYTDTEYIYGKIPLDKKNPVLAEFINKEIAKLSKIKDNLPDGADFSEIGKKLQQAKEAYKCLI